MKKRFIVCTIAFLSLCALCACGGSKPENTASLANPMTEMTREEVGEKTGVILSAPADASDVKYSVLDAGNDEKTAQVDFTYNGKAFTYRARVSAGLEPYDMTGLNYSWSEEKDAQVASCPAKLMLCDEAAGLYWIDIVPAINYSLGCVGAVSEEEILEVAELVFESLQNSILEHASEIKNLAGVYQNGDSEDCDRIELKDAGDNKYDFSISVSGLAEMTGSGNDLGGAVDITMTAPDGQEIGCIFYTERDGTYSLLITLSDWKEMKEGSEIKGFIPVE